MAVGVAFRIILNYSSPKATVVTQGFESGRTGRALFTVEHLGVQSSDVGLSLGRSV